jgi:hypothetical protein
MAISWMDMDELRALLDGGLDVALVNATDPESAAELLGAVLALHGATGSPQVRRAAGVSLLAGDAYAFDEDLPLLPDVVIGVEAVLRVASPIARSIVEVYLHSDSDRTTPIERMEIGIVGSDKATSDAVPIPDVEGLSAFIKLEP